MLKQGGLALQNIPLAQSQSLSAYKINQEMLMKALSGRPSTDMSQREKKKRQNAACVVQVDGNALCISGENRDRAGSSVTSEEREDWEFNRDGRDFSIDRAFEQLETDFCWL
jgi:hypothetical protein